MIAAQRRVAAGALAVGLLAAPWWSTTGHTSVREDSQPTPAAAPAPARPAAGSTVQAGAPLDLPRDLPQLIEAARAVRTRYGVPMSVTLAQAFHESGNGRSGLARQHLNLFGIKCGGVSQAGSTSTGCATLDTEECQPACGRTAASFRVYPTWQASVADYGHLLAVVPAYRPAFTHRDDPVAFARAVAAAGYATDPAYAAKVAARVVALRGYDR